PPAAVEAGARTPPQGTADRSARSVVPRQGTGARPDAARPRAARARGSSLLPLRWWGAGLPAAVIVADDGPPGNPSARVHAGSAGHPLECRPLRGGHVAELVQAHAHYAALPGRVDHRLGLGGRGLRREPPDRVDGDVRPAGPRADDPDVVGDVAVRSRGPV